MKVELTIRQGSLETQVTITGYHIMVEALLKAVKEIAMKKDNTAEIR